MGFPEKPNQEGRFKVHQPDPDTNRLMTLAELKIMELRFKQAAEKTIKRVKALRDERARCEERLRQIDEELHQLEGDLRASSISPGNIPSLPEVGVRPRQGSPNPKGRGATRIASPAGSLPSCRRTSARSSTRACSPRPLGFPTNRKLGLPFPPPSANSRIAA